MGTGFKTIVGAVAALCGCSVVVEHDTSFLPSDGLEGSWSPGACHRDRSEEAGLECSDGCDNDNDGATDCDDTDCVCFTTEVDCTDQIDNDSNGLVDCDDPVCVATRACYLPTSPEGVCLGREQDLPCCSHADREERCCGNGQDDDDDGVTDCQEPECQQSEYCCGREVQVITEQGSTEGQTPGFDPRLWLPFFRSRQPEWDSTTLRLVNWQDDGMIGGVTLRNPVDVAYGVNLSFHVALSPAEGSGQGCLAAPWDAGGFTGLALAPVEGPSRETEEPRPVVSVLVTADHRLVVVRGGPSMSNTQLCLGLEQQEPGSVFHVELALTPGTDGEGRVGYRLELSLAGVTGREVCGAAGSFAGCREVAHWKSPGLLLGPGEDRLLTGQRGLYVMVLGSGTGVELSDRDLETVSVRPRQCANPGAWSATADESPLTTSSLCWADGALGSPSVAPRPSNAGYAMVVEGSTREVVPAGYGVTRFSLGWLTSVDLPFLAAWTPNSDSGIGATERYRPMDTPYEANCLGWTDWPAPECRGDGALITEPPAGCDGEPSRRSPHVIPESSSNHILFAQAREDHPSWSELAVATYFPSGMSWNDGFGQTVVRPDQVDLAQYRSFRDPVAVCRPEADLPVDGCASGRYLVLFVGERASPGSSPGGVVGDDLLALPFLPGSGFDPQATELVIAGDGDHPLAGRVLAEPSLVWDRTATADASWGRLYLWLTVRSPGGPSRVELYRFEPDEVGLSEFGLAHGSWLPYGGNPVLTAQDLQNLWPRLDCSGRCDLGGVAALVAPHEDQRSMLHLWVSVVERPATNDRTAQYSIRHLTQPWAPDYGSSFFFR